MYKICILIMTFIFSILCFGAKYKSEVELPGYCEPFKIELSKKEKKGVTFKYSDNRDYSGCNSEGIVSITNQEFVDFAQTVTSKVRESAFKSEGEVFGKKLLNSAVNNLFEVRKKYLELDLFEAGNQFSGKVDFNRDIGIFPSKHKHLLNDSNRELQAIQDAQIERYKNLYPNEKTRATKIQEERDQNRDNLIEFNFFKAIVAQARLKQVENAKKKASENLKALEEDFKLSEEYEKKLESCYAKSYAPLSYKTDRGLAQECPRQSKRWVKEHLAPFEAKSKETLLKVKAPLYKLAQQSPLLFDAKTKFSVTDWVEFEPAASKFNSALVKKGKASDMVAEIASLLEKSDTTGKEIDFASYFAENSARTKDMVEALKHKDKKTLIGRRETTSLHPILVSTVIGHIREINKSATKIAQNNGSGLQHSPALVGNILKGENNKESLKKSLAGQCYLIQKDREKEVSYGWRTYTGAGLALVGAGLELAPIAGTVIGTSLITVGGGLAGSEAIENFNVAQKNLGNASSLNELGLISYDQFLKRKNENQDAINDIGLELFVLADVKSFANSLKAIKAKNANNIVETQNGTGTRLLNLFDPVEPLLERVGKNNIKIEDLTNGKIIDTPFVDSVTDATNGKVVKLPANHYNIKFVADQQERKFHLVIPARADGVADIQKLNVIEEAISELPKKALKDTDRFIVHPYRNKHDSYWAKRFDTDNFRSAATAGGGATQQSAKHATINLFPLERGSRSSNRIKEIMYHELGHIVAFKKYGSTEPDKVWDAAKGADGKSISKYGDNTLDEDFAEAMELYIKTDGGALNPQALRDFPNRFKILDEILEMDVDKRKEILVILKDRLFLKDIVVATGSRGGSLYIIKKSIEKESEGDEIDGQ